MALKIFRAIWFLSMLAMLASLLLTYGFLPETVLIQETDHVMVSKEVIFYSVLVLSAILNTLVYVVSKFYPKDEALRTWFHGLIITINIFLIIALSYLNVYNSQEKYDYSRIGFIVYGSVWLVVGWVITLPLIKFLYRKNIQ